MSYNLDLPEERARCAEAEGVARYNTLMEEHRERQVVETYRGHQIRLVPTRFGRLHMVPLLGSAYTTLPQAREAIDARLGPVVDVSGDSAAV